MNVNKAIVMRIAHFWVITQRVVVISRRRFGTNYRSIFSVFLTPEDGADRLLRNVGNKLPLLAA